MAISIYSDNYLLKHFYDRGIITIDDVAGSDKETIMEKIIAKIHNRPIGRTTDGRYYTYVTDKTKPHGRRQVRRKSKTDLYRALIEFYSSEGVGKKGRMSFQKLFEEWIEYKKIFVNAKNRKKSLSPSTIRRYERDFERYFTDSELIHKPIESITSVMLEKSLKDIFDRHSVTESSADNVLGYIGQAFDYAERSGYLSKNPFSRIDRQLLLAMTTFSPPKPDSERVLTLHEMQALRKATLDHEVRHPDYMPDYAIELAMLTGMRVGELAALKWECIDEHVIHIDYSEHRLDYKDRPSELIIDEPKNGKHRVVPVTDEIMELFSRIRSITASYNGFVFVREDGSRYTAHTISCAVCRRAEEAGISSTSIHEIRRTVSSMLRVVLPPRAVANMLGHLELTNDLYYNYDTTEEIEKRRALSEVSSKVIKIA